MGGAYPESDTEIFIYDIATGLTTQLTDNEHHDRNPQIDSGIVTWFGDDGNDLEIFMAMLIPSVEETEEYITYVDEAIRSLPDEMFVRPEEDIPDVKNDFTDLLNDALENIEEGEYVLAIDKLNRINDLKYAEMTDSAERQEINDLIDNLIGYLETLF